MIVRCVQTLSLEQYQQKLGLDREAPQATTPVEEEDDEAQVRAPLYFSLFVVRKNSPVTLLHVLLRSSVAVLPKCVAVKRRVLIYISLSK